MDRCDICGTEGRFERFQLREMLFGLRETFEYHRCPGCGVMRIGSVPSDLGRHYPTRVLRDLGARVIGWRARPETVAA